jgi:hypothetical protein
MNNDELKNMFFMIMARLHDDAEFSVDAQLRAGTIESEEMAQQMKEAIMDDCETVVDFIDFMCRKHSLLMKDSEYETIN